MTDVQDDKAGSQPTLPMARVYEVKSGWSKGWWFKFAADECAFGPFQTPIDAGRACREEVVRRAEEIERARQ